MESKHTKGIYYVYTPPSMNTLFIESNVDGLKIVIAEVKNGKHVSNLIANANAEHIVKCVNAHDELVLALKNVIRVFGENKKKYIKPEDALQLIGSIQAANALLNKLT